MLAVDVEQEDADLPEGGNRRRPAVDAAAALSLGADLPLNEQGSVLLRRAAERLQRNARLLRNVLKARADERRTRAS